MNSFKIFPFIQFEIFKDEISFVVHTKNIYEIIYLLKNHFNYQFKLLTCISGIDFPKNIYRFNIAYELMSLVYNYRIRIKSFLNELVPTHSIQAIFSSSNWWECEIWDMFGIFFRGHYNLTKILTDYGFQGYPLRKDFPLSGFYESKYHYLKHRVIYENLEFAQEYRTFDFPINW